MTDGRLRPTDVLAAFFACGVAFLVAAAAVAVAQALSPWPWGRWLALHLAFAGGVSQLILGASQFFAGAFLATDPPPRAMVRAQLVAWNLGAILLAVAVPERAAAPTWIAVGLLLAGLALWGVALDGMRRRSLRRAPWATRWYAGGAVFLALGAPAGSLLANGTGWPHGNLLGAHMALNLAGWFGAAIVGTLHTFYPSLTQTELRHPRLQGVAFAAWMAGVAALAVGYAWAIDPLALAGWLALCLGCLALLVNIAASLRAAARPLSLAARLVGVAQPFLLAGLAVAAVAAVADGPAQALTGATRSAAGTLLLAGWIGLTVAGSLLHLLAVLVGVRSGFAVKMPAARPHRDGAIAAVAATGVASLAISQGSRARRLARSGRGAPACGLRGDSGADRGARHPRLESALLQASRCGLGVCLGRCRPSWTPHGQRLAFSCTYRFRKTATREQARPHHAACGAIHVRG